MYVGLTSKHKNVQVEYCTQCNYNMYTFIQYLNSGVISTKIAMTTCCLGIFTEFSSGIQ